MPGVGHLRIPGRLHADRLLQPVPVRAPVRHGDPLYLSAGDIDEAVAGLLSNGLAASDVDGGTVPAGFTRIAAFRGGVLGEMDACYSRFPG